jgi:hypothetical protein
MLARAWLVFSFFSIGGGMAKNLLGIENQYAEAGLSDN